MSKTAYSPDTGELIVTNNPGAWMGLTDLVPPVFDRATQGCFFREGAWVIVDAVIAPVVKPPIIVTPWQIRKALNATGLRESVESAVAAADTTTKDAWQYATSFVRTDPLLDGMAKVMGKTDAEIDALFELALTL